MHRDTREMLLAINQKFIPNKVLVLVPTEIDSPEIKLIAPYTKQQKSIHNRATAYICINYDCKLPTTDIPTMLQLLM